MRWVDGPPKYRETMFLADGWPVRIGIPVPEGTTTISGKMVKDLRVFIGSLSRNEVGTKMDDLVYADGKWGFGDNTSRNEARKRLADGPSL